MPLTFPNLVNIFVKMQRLRRKAIADAPDSPRSVQEKEKGHHIRSISGDGPQNHHSLADIPSEPGLKLRREDFFVCANGVDIPKLLRATRASLLDEAISIGGNALVQEEWSSTICGPKNRRSGYFHVKISYSAVAVSSSTRDPGRPVAQHKAKSVPGLMTIVQRKNLE